MVVETTAPDEDGSTERRATAAYGAFNYRDVNEAQQEVRALVGADGKATTVTVLDLLPLPSWAVDQ